MAAVLKLVKIPPKMLNIRAPLPWDVYDSTRSLFALRGTIIGSYPFGMEPDLYFEERFHPAYQREQKNGASTPFNFPTPSKGIIAGEEKGANPLYQFTCDTNAKLSDQIDSVIRHTSRLLNNYQSNSDWAHAIYKHAQAIAFLIDQNPAAVFLALYIRRAFYEEHYPAAQAVMRAVMAYLSACTLPRLVPSHKIALICACLTCDLSIYRNLFSHSSSRIKVVLKTQEERAFLKDHGKRSYEMLKAAEIVDSYWLFIVKRHERPVALDNPEGVESHMLHLLNDIVYFADIAAARSAYRKDRDPLPLFNAIANVSFDSNKSPIFAGCQLSKVMGMPPLGSILATHDGLMLTFGPDRAVLITNEMYELKSNYRLVKKLDFKSMKYQVRAPKEYVRMKELMVSIVDSFGMDAKLGQDDLITKEIE